MFLKEFCHILTVLDLDYPTNFLSSCKVVPLHLVHVVHTYFVAGVCHFMSKHIYTWTETQAT